MRSQVTLCVILDPAGNPAAKKKCRQAKNAYLEKGSIMSPKILPTFKGYTVDLDRQEFRRTLPDGTLETIRFFEHKGWELFWELAAFAERVVNLIDYK